MVAWVVIFLSQMTTSSAPAAIVVRPYRHEDNPVVVHIWREGFMEMLPDIFQLLVRRVVLAAGLALAGLLAVARLPTAALVLAAIVAALQVRAVGGRVLEFFLRRSANKLAKASMGPDTLPQKWMSEPGATFLVATDGPGGRVVGCVAVTPHHTLHEGRVACPPCRTKLPFFGWPWIRRCGVGAWVVPSLTLPTPTLQLMVQRASPWKQGTRRPRSSTPPWGTRRRAWIGRWWCCMGPAAGLWGCWHR